MKIATESKQQSSQVYKIQCAENAAQNKHNKYKWRRTS